jgi:quercetin dioxygenase-like cupin family protein
MSRKRETAYEAWMKREGIPIVEGYGVEDVMEIPRGPWARTGGKGAFVLLRGMEGFTSMVMGEIPSGGALNPERHLYEEVIYIVDGIGSTEVWSKEEKKRISFEWQTGSIFAVPLNCWHRLVNGSREPVLYLAATSAPIMMDLLHDHDFIFGCDYVFDQRFDGRHDYFVTSSVRDERRPGSWVWESNFIADARSSTVDASESKGAGVRITAFDMAGSTLVGHIAEWPVGRYHKAHHHQGGAILLILRSEGYTLMWPQELGMRPYLSGHGDNVVKVDWRERSIFSPPTGWFHQHFNTGREKARQLAFRYSGDTGKHLFGIVKALNREGVLTSVRDGGTLIEYEDEDPQIRGDYETVLHKEGVAMEMPAVEYRDL